MTVESVSLIPQDPLTRRLLAKILAKMIKDDFEQARADRDDGQASIPQAADHNDEQAVVTEEGVEILAG